MAAAAVALLVAAPISCDRPAPSPAASAAAAGSPTSSLAAAGIPSPSPTVAGTPRGTAAGLWCLCGPAAALELRTVGGTSIVTLPPSIADPSWASGDAATGFVVTAGRGGGIYDSGPHPGTVPRWTRLALSGVTAEDPDRDWSFGAVSPDGSRVAAIAGRPGSGVRDTRLIVVSRSDGHATVTAIAAEEDGRPAVWLDDRTIAVPIRDDLDRPALEIVDLATGRQRTVTTDSGAIASAAAAGSIAFQARSDGTILVGPSSSLGTRAAFAALPTGTTARTAGQLLLDDGGRRLAAMWIDDTGDPASIGVYERTVTSWTFVAEFILAPGTTRAVLAGFDP
ncbi:MAG: hypothetical protein ACYDCI_09825 [Candidatus Limnocylindrales bacterium]